MISALSTETAAGVLLILRTSLEQLLISPYYHTPMILSGFATMHTIIVLPNNGMTISFLLKKARHNIHVSYYQPPLFWYCFEQKAASANRGLFTRRPHAGISRLTFRDKIIMAALVFSYSSASCRTDISLSLVAIVTSFIRRIWWLGGDEHNAQSSRHLKEPIIMLF